MDRLSLISSLRSLGWACLTTVAVTTLSSGNALALTCAQAPSGYACSALDAPGAISTRANGINNSGRVSGYIESLGISSFTSNGSSFDFPAPPAGTSAAYGFGMNDAGHLVGYSLGSTGFRGFVWDGVQYSTIAMPNATHTFAYGINAAGTIAGSYQTSPTAVSGFLLTGNQYQSVSVTGAKSTYLYGVNNDGTLAGTYISGTGEIVGFTQKGAAREDIRVPGAKQTYVRGINNIGDVVGNYVDATGASQGFAKLSNGSFWTFSIADALRTTVMGINDSRAIAGFYALDEYSTHGFLADVKPLPLPSAALMLAGGLVMLGRTLRSQSKVQTA